MAGNQDDENKSEVLRLMTLGFTKEEATRLVDQKNHAGENTEYREIMEVKHRLNFVRWLIEHNRLSS